MDSLDWVLACMNRQDSEDNHDLEPVYCMVMGQVGESRCAGVVGTAVAKDSTAEEGIELAVVVARDHYSVFDSGSTRL